MELIIRQTKEEDGHEVLTFIWPEIGFESKLIKQDGAPMQHTEIVNNILQVYLFEKTKDLNCAAREEVVEDYFDEMYLIMLDSLTLQHIRKNSLSNANKDVISFENIPACKKGCRWCKNH